MKIYEERRSSPIKWVIAIIIFVIVLTVTFDEVLGVPIPRGEDYQTADEMPPPDHTYDTKSYGDDSPPQIPEPATLILLGTGLAAMRLLRKKKA